MFVHEMSAILKPSRLFPSCLQRKADWEKTSKMQPVSTPSFKKESDLGECERATTHKRLFWNINTLTPSFSLNLRPQHSQQTLIHTKCYLEVSMDAHTRVSGFIWGLKWATDQNWCWNLVQCSSAQTWTLQNRCHVETQKTQQHDLICFYTP